MLHGLHAMLDPLLPLSGDCKAFYTLYFVHIDRVFGKFKEYEISDIQVKPDGCGRQAPKDSDTVDIDILAHHIFSFHRRVLLPVLLCKLSG